MRVYCIKASYPYYAYGLVVGGVYEADDQYIGSAYPVYDNLYYIIVPRFSGRWFNRDCFVEAPDVTSCMKCGITYIASDEDVKNPCPINTHKWLKVEC